MKWNSNLVFHLAQQMEDHTKKWIIVYFKLIFSSVEELLAAKWVKYPSQENINIVERLVIATNM